MPWIRYHHLLLAPNSTAEEGNLFVDSGELRHALEVIFAAMAYEATPFPVAVDPGPALPGGFGTRDDPLPMLVSSQSPSSGSELPYFFHVPKGQSGT